MPRIRAISELDDQLAPHLAAAVVLLQVAVDRERAGLIGAELEGDGLAGPDALGDPVRVDREAVGDVVAPERDLHEVVLHRPRCAAGVKAYLRAAIVELRAGRRLFLSRGYRATRRSASVASRDQQRRVEPAVMPRVVC